MTDTREDILSLAACPHCEGQAKIVSGGPGNHYVRCTTCAAQTTDGSIERVVAAWNRRASPPAPAVAVPDGLERLLTTSPIIEELTPRHHDWERCETIGDLYDMMKERVRAALRLLPAAPTPPAAEAPGQEPVGFNGGYEPDGSYRFHKINLNGSPLEKKQVELDCMTRLKAIQEERTAHWRQRAEALEAAAEAPGQEPVAWIAANYGPPLPITRARMAAAKGDVVLDAAGEWSNATIPLYAAPTTYADAEAMLRPMSEARKNGKEVVVATSNRAGLNGYLIAHWASDMSGSEQRPFEGWFYWTGHGFREIPEADLLGWCELPRIRYITSPAPKGEGQ